MERDDEKETKAKKNKVSYLWAGIAGGFTAVTCCIAPVVLVLLGLGTAFSMMVMHKLHLISIVSGVILMLLIVLIIIKRKSGVCNIKSMRQNWKIFPFAIIFLVLSWAFINYLIVAPIAGVVYGNLDVDKKALGNIVAMAQEMDMPEMADIEVIPEMQGKKILELKIDGIFCGSCGPALAYDIKSIEGVVAASQVGKKIKLIYDSDITSKDVILANVHDPYSATIILEQKIKDNEVKKYIKDFELQALEALDEDIDDHPSIDSDFDQQNLEDAFAICLNVKGAKMYGAYWCPHCNDQKSMFGDSFSYIEYIECSLPERNGQTEVCKQAGIKSYPTWEFADGSRIEGKLTLEKLSQKTGCSN